LVKTPRQSLNKAFLKLKPNRPEIERFKENLKKLLSKIDDVESEENQKNHVRDFLRDTYYAGKYEINTKDRNDLVIHNGKDSKTSVGVILEAKRPNNKSEMLKKENINAKAFQELVLYFLRERITENNKEIKYLVATNIYEWFIFDAQEFEKTFANNKEFVKQFTDFEEKRLSGTKTEFFYKEIAEPFLANNKDIPFTYFDIRDYKEALENEDKKDDVKLIALFKLLSPEHLLKLPFLNDSNSLDKSFYSELLHIIGLEETKDGSKKIIQRKKSGERNSASLIENAIIQLDSLDKIHRIENSSQYGNSYEEKLFSVAIELVITWVNRILFLKLLEAQQIKYHKGDENFAYLNSKKIKGFDDLNTLFFQVLSRKTNERSEEIKKLFALVPYLNSSLFEISTLEDRCFTISQLKDNGLPIFAGTVLKENTGKKKSGQIGVLDYFFEFLEAYDFSSEGSEEIQEENKTLINASVLGLIFEKINGYKDGSFFTPGFITTNMCRETIRRAVVQKFNETKGWNCKDFNDLYNKIDTLEIKEANQIINSLKVCDPAVGSGHFLVSALNEIITIKSELGVLTDRTGKKIKDYSIEVENDELIISDKEDGILFEYNPKNKESQRIQEALFHEKQTIIENCLFGVDINQNSVNICRLRLWIELLKNAYYISSSDNTELQTLPNIDINIKKGNSLISKHALDSDIKSILKKRKWKIEDYKNAVHSYQNAKDKSEKREMDVLIHSMKTEFIVELNDNHPDEVALRKVNQKLAAQSMFELSKKEIDEIEKAKKEKLRLETKLQEMKDNKIYQNSFEWRFEFPEVLNEDGDFVGFDVVIGNPPYIRQELFSDIKPYLQERYAVYNSIADLLTYFVELGFTILKKKGVFQFIISNKFTRANYGKELRKFLLDNTSLTHFIDFSGIPVFDEATVDAAIVGYVKGKEDDNSFLYANIQKADFIVTEFEKYLDSIKRYLPQKTLNENTWAFETAEVLEIKNKVEAQGVPLENWNITINYGIKTGLNDAFVIDGEKRKELIKEDPKSKEIIKRMLRGRDIQKYYPIYEDLWLINLHNGYDEDEKRIPALKAENYPSVKKHLDQFLPQLKKRADKGETPYNLRNCAYVNDFEKTKIIYPEMTKFLNFTLDVDDKFYTNNKNFIFTGERLYWLTSFFNSQLWRYCFRDNFPELLGGTRELRKVFFEKIPVKQITEKQELPFKKLVEKIIEAKKKDPAADTGKWEKEIDEMVYKLYGLTEGEIKIVSEL
jgi:type II restriction/modification system DNA methylase subunit YeeA